jgi:hypothetical protein
VTVLIHYFPVTVLIHYFPVTVLVHCFPVTFLIDCLPVTVLIDCFPVTVLLHCLQGIEVVKSQESNQHSTINTPFNQGERTAHRSVSEEKSGICNFF